MLIDPTDRRREILCRRLRAQGYIVEDTGDAAVGAHMALSSPPAAIVADLWMPGISGVQLCRLLGSEPATVDVSVVLCVDRDEPRSRFWADRAGAAAYVLKGRTGELVRALAKAVDSIKAKLPAGSFIETRGQVATMEASFTGMAYGLVFAILLVYFLRQKKAPVDLVVQAIGG